MTGRGESLDAICRGEVRILQHLRGYRFNLDPLLLADFAAAQGLAGPVVDLGTGTGIIALLLVRRYGLDRVSGLELQPELFQLASRNVRLNACEQEISLSLGDIRCVPELYPPRRFAHVVSNPPYRSLEDSRTSPDPEKAIARSEVACTLTDLVRAAAWLLAERGGLHVVIPAARLSALLVELTRERLAPRRLRLVHPRASLPAHLALVTALRAGSHAAPLDVLPPLILHRGEGARFSPEVEQILC